MTMPSVGDKAPWPAGVTDQHGAAVTLTQHAGKHVLLYFYPKDDTPGCTVEACNFRDHRTDIDAVIYGISLDDAASHKAFIAKFNLPFSLLVETTGALAKAYGTIIPDRQYPTRSSFLVGPNGTLKAVWPKVDPKTHWEEVKAAIAAK